MFHHRADWGTRLSLPHSRRPVVTRRDHTRVVRAKCHPHDTLITFVPYHRTDRCARLSIPQAHRDLARCDDARTVRAECPVINTFAMFHLRAERCTGLNVPYLSRPVATSCDHTRAVHAECHALDFATMFHYLVGY